MSAPSRAPRVLACVPCQQRKIRCDRKFPCANCAKSQSECVPATQTRNRRPRFPERALLDRIQQYEDLLRRNGVKFVPLHRERDDDSQQSAVYERMVASDPDRYGASDNWSSPSTVVESESTPAAKDFWSAMAQRSSEPHDDSDSQVDTGEAVARDVWDQLFETDDGILPSHRSDVGLPNMHPEPVRIFQLWQIYLDNVNPLLKVTHAPTMQERIVRAAGDMASIEPSLEALMFGMYSMAILSIEADDCQSRFGSSKEQLLTRYLSGCQQALTNGNYLRTNDRDCLTALYLYLLSIRPRAHPRAVASISSIAIHIAQRMGIHSEAILARCPVFEAEMRRRLWWSLMLFDARISQLASSKETILLPTWDCNVPLNASDSDLRAEMRQLPAQGKSGEAVFALVRSVLADFVRHTDFHLDFSSPGLKPIAKHHGSGPAVRALDAFERMMEEEHLRFCSPDIPLHFFTLWTTRAQLCKYRLIEHYSRYSSPSAHVPDEARDAAVSHAVGILEADTMILTSPAARGFLWHWHMYVPAPAYIHILQDFRRRPKLLHAERAWAALSANYAERFVSATTALRDTPLCRFFDNLIAQAWQARLAAQEYEEEKGGLETPGIVTLMREQAERVERARGAEAGGDGSAAGDEFAVPMPTSTDGHDLMYGIAGPGFLPGPPMGFDATLPLLGGGPFGWGFGDYGSW